MISYGLVTEKTEGCTVPWAWFDLTVPVNKLHCTMRVIGSSVRVIWPVWWLVTTMMAENSALERGYQTYYMER
eukprot:SAG11_NODE_22037_length_413_cov_1.143312_2_plen_73_part_00